MPLEEVCLNIIATGLTRKCAEFLAMAPQPPLEECVNAAVDRLKLIGAIEVFDASDTLTSLGHHLAQLPLDARLGKMLIYGALFKCVDPISTIAACLSTPKSIFISNVGDNSQTKSTQSIFYHPTSDFLTLVKAYDAFDKAGVTGNSRRFCQRHFLNYQTLLEVRTAKTFFIELLCDIGFLSKASLGAVEAGRRCRRNRLQLSSYNVNSDNEGLLHCVVFAGVYPNFARLINIHCSARGNNKQPPQLEQKSETLEIHRSSVNYKLPSQIASSWIAYNDKLSTSRKRVTLSTTCFVDPMCLLLFGKSLTIKHFERKVIVDDWVEIGVAAQTAVTIRAIRLQLDQLLTSYFDRSCTRLQFSPIPGRSPSDSTVDSIVRLLTHSSVAGQHGLR